MESAPGSVSNDTVSALWATMTSCIVGWRPKQASSHVFLLETLIMYGLATSIILLSTSTSVFAQECRYALFDISSLGGPYSDARGISSDGMVATSPADENGFVHVAVWMNGTFAEDRGIGGGIKINDAHDVCGVGGVRMGTLWRANGEAVPLGALGGQFSSAYDINDLGQITGYADLPENNPDRGHAFLWENGQMRDLGSPGLGSTARAINNRTQIVGEFTPVDSNSTGAFLWENDQFIVLPNLSGSRPAVALDLNDDGVAVGWAGVPLYTHAVKWIDGEITDINDGGVTDTSRALCINNRGDIGGNMYSRAEQRTVGFLLEAGATRMLNLNDYLPPHRDFDITWVNGINDFGQIAGRDVARDHGVILSPVTPAMLLSEPTPGSAGRNNILTITGATPGERIIFLYSLHGGGTVIPGCDLQTGAAAQIDDPIVIGAANADSRGVASITRFVPPIAQGRDILIQAVQKNGCKVSQLVVHRFE